MSLHVRVRVCLLCDLCLLFTRRQLSVITQREIAYTVRKSRICYCKNSFNLFYLYLLIIIYCFQVISPLTLPLCFFTPISLSVLSALCYFSCRCLGFFSRLFLFRFICTISSWSFHISSLLLFFSSASSLSSRLVFLTLLWGLICMFSRDFWRSLYRSYTYKADIVR